MSDFVFAGVTLAFTVQLRAELGAGVPELCSLVRVDGVAESVCLGSRSVSVSQKWHIEKSTWFREPCHSSSTVWGGGGADGLVCLSIWELPCPGPSSIPEQGLVSGGWHQPVDLSLGGISCPAHLRGVPLALPTHSNSSRQPAFQTAVCFSVDFGGSHSFLCFCLISYLCCVNGSTAFASQGHLITAQNFIASE